MASSVQGDGLVLFRKEVQELKNKQQSKIQSLTQLADNNYALAEDIAKILLDEIASATNNRVQPLVSVVDSILKKVGKDYKTHLGARMPDTMSAVRSRSDAAMSTWLEKMVNLSWRKHDLLPTHTLDRLDLIFAAPLAAPAAPVAFLAPEPAMGAFGAPGFFPAACAGTAPTTEPPPPLQPASMQVDGEGASVSAAAAALLRRAGPAPPMKAPPARPPPVAPLPAATVAAAAPPTVAVAAAAAQGSVGAAAAAAAPAAAAAGKASSSAAAMRMTPELVERRLGILTKIIERRNPSAEELSEIMKVPEIRQAIAMQQKGERQSAMKVLSQFKQELERMACDTMPAAAVPPRDPRQPADGRLLDPRQAEDQAPQKQQQQQRAADPRQQLDSQSAAGAAATRSPSPLAAAPASAQDPRQPPPDPRRRSQEGVAAEKRPADDEAAAEPAKRARAVAADSSAPGADAGSASPTAAALADGKPGAETVEVSDDEDEQASRAIVPARQILQGLPSIGFSEAWLRQFMEQMPTKAPPLGAHFEAPSVGRKVLGATGEQMVYVDELSPNETLLLLQLVFLLEERLRRTGGSADLAQRIPHTFSYLQVDAAVDVMLKRLFGELPFQCTTTGLRFASQDKLKKHHDALHRRKAQAQQRQRGAEARGWIESIPEWVGNRDLVVGPALFRLGQPGEASGAAQEAQSKPHNPGPDDEDPVDGEPGSRWHCPFDERRSVCPISGEQLDRTWSAALNCWAFADCVAVEPGSTRPLRFPPGGPIGPRGLSETAVLFKKSCFFNTPTIRQLESLEHSCGAPAAEAATGLGGAGGTGSSPAGAEAPRKLARGLSAEELPRTSIAGIPAPKKAPSRTAAAQDPALAALAASRPVVRKCF